MPLLDYKTAYLLAGLFYGAIWLWFFLLRKDDRRQMILISLFIVALAPINVIWHGDYWKPPYIFGELIRFEDYLWGFAFGGVTAVSYETFFRRKLKRLIFRTNTEVIRSLVLVLAIIILTMFVFSSIIHLNSIYAVSLALIFLVFYMIFERPDLLNNMLWSGLFAALTVFIFYVVWQAIYPGVFNLYWNLPVISNIFLSGVPIEEIVWFFLAGMAIGPLDEFLFGYQTIKITRRKI